METNYYNASNNFSAPIRKEPKPYIPKSKPEKKPEPETLDVKEECQKQTESDLEVFERFKSDDLIILGLLFILLTESNDDYLLLLMLGYLLLSGNKSKK